MEYIQPTHMFDSVGLNQLKWKKLLILIKNIIYWKKSLTRKEPFSVSKNWDGRTDGQTDGQTDGRKKPDVEVGAPPKNMKISAFSLHENYDFL